MSPLCELCVVTDGPPLHFELHQKAEIVIAHDHNGRNPFDAMQVDLQIRLTSPAGRVWRLPAFFDARDTRRWRFRFTPDAPGTWQLQPEERIRARVGPITSVHVQRSNARPIGPVRVDRRNPAYLAYPDARPFVPIGANIAWFTRDPIGEYTRRLDALAAAGGNTTRIWLAPWSFAIEGRESGLRNYIARQQRAGWLDEVIELARARNIQIILVLLEPGMFDPAQRWADNPYNIANGGPLAVPADFLTDPAARAAYKNQLRYLAARWGYAQNILAWEWMNEVNSAPGFDTTRLIPWLREMTPALRQHLRQSQLSTISYAAVDGDPRVWALPEIDLIQRHEYTQGDPKWFDTLRDQQGRPMRFKQVREQPPKPVLAAEFGANSVSETPTGAYREGIHLHNGLWGGVFSGMSGGAMYWWWDAYLEAGNLWPRHQGLARFVAGEDLARMSPGEIRTDSPSFALAAMSLQGEGRALVWIRNKAWSHDRALTRYIVSASTGEARPDSFVYRPEPVRTVTVTLPDMPGGRYRLMVYDTTRGTVVREHTVIANASGLTFLLDEVQRDVAVKLERL
jgi:Domain of unknown function (DUF5060)/Cellulase (glycosyl hydrolase family 5)